MLIPSMTSFYLVALLAAFCIGLSKAGFSGISMVSVILLADLYGAKASVGLALPLLIAADLMAYPAFRKHGSWRPVWKLLGPALVGLGVGWWMLGWIPDAAARRVIGACVLMMVTLQVSRRWKPEVFDRLVESKPFGISAGILGGFATMLANAAGPVIQLYLTARKIPKMELIGIGARFFLLINLIKVPLNARLALINSDSLLENARLLPAVVVGILSGKWLIRHVPQAAFEWMIVVFSMFAGLRLLIW
ncbi:MAG: sulfite exporter TauE/SafE family protein [Gloeobacteraceae cyanobacterium ES-bin-144]|nr:sulfite exporter TauE/SafE family protein [Verrucomicrobiales bacterium]